MFLSVAKTGLLLLPLCLLAPLASGQNRTWIVDDGPESAEFATIQAAIDAAADGDAILIRPGTYREFVIDDKALSLVAERSGTVRLIDYFDLDPAIEVRNLAAGKRVLIRGIYAERIHAINDDQHRTANLVHNDGLVLIEDCELVGKSTTYLRLGGRALRVRNSAAVVLSRCQLTAGVVSLYSGVSLYDCAVTGADGQVCDVGTASKVGRPGLDIEGGQVLVSGTLVQGGRGGDGDSFLGCCERAGGAGVKLHGPDPQLALLDSKVVAGAKGSGTDCGTPPILDILVESGSVTQLSGSAHRAGSNGFTSVGEPLRLFHEGRPDEVLLIAFAASAAPQFLSELGGTLLLDLATTSFLPTTVLPAGQLLTDVPFTALPPGVQGLTLFTQSLTLGGPQPPVLGPPSGALLADLEQASAGGTDCDADGTADIWEILLQDLPDDDVDGVPNDCDAFLLIHVDDDAPGDPGPGDPGLSDPLEDGSPAHPFDAVQEAILAAPTGSYVVVQLADGTYTGSGNRDIDFGGRDLCVRSENGPSACTIDAQGLGRAFVFHSGESHAALIDGLTLTGGLAADGGALLISNADPTVRHCIFRDNHSEPSYFALGGAAFVEDSRSGFFDCSFEANTTAGTGGALHFASDLSSPAGQPQDAPVVMRCSFVGNSARRGGAVTLGDSIDDLWIFASSFLDNHADEDGGALELRDGALVESCFFARNRAEKEGGAVSRSNNFLDPFVLRNCTLRGNEAGERGGALGIRGKAAQVLSSILWDNRADDPLAAQELFVDGTSFVDSELEVRHSLVAGGRTGVGVGFHSILIWGPGNLDVDPVFVGVDLGDPHLAGGSPCIDMADPQLVPSVFDRDIDGSARRSGPAVDMGADEFAP